MDVQELRAILEVEIHQRPNHGFDVRAPTVFMGAGSPWSGAHSYAGNLHGPNIKKHLPVYIGKVGGYPRWYVPFRDDRFRYTQLPKLTRRFPGLQVVDFSADRRYISQHEDLCLEAGAKLFTFTQAMDALDLTPVYETPRDVRAKTIEHLERFLTLLDTFDDELSKVTLLSVLLHRITLNRKFLDTVLVDESEEYFSADGDTLALRDDEIFCDLGAANGQIVRKFLGASNSKYRAIHAFEPDSGNFRKLSELKKHGVRDLYLYNVAVGATRGTTAFLEANSYSSHAVESGGTSVDVVALDDVMDGASFIKMDIEGSEPDAIKGAAGLIKRCRPRMAICVYHYATDLLEVTELLKLIRPDYKYRLRQHSLTFWDTVLYAY